MLTTTATTTSSSFSSLCLCLGQGWRSMRTRPQPCLRQHQRRRRRRASLCKAEDESESKSKSDINNNRVSSSLTDNEKEKSLDVVLPVPDKAANNRIALLSMSVAVGLFAASRGWVSLSGSPTISLADLSLNAVPYEQAIQNGMPTVLEFYADWCEVCRELAPDVYKVEQEYKNQVNFVMLNVENIKWEEEIDEFGVEGIPHFSFLDREGHEKGNVVGRIPRQYFKDNVAALARGDMRIPHSRIVGQFSRSESRQPRLLATDITVSYPSNLNLTLLLHGVRNTIPI